MTNTLSLESITANLAMIMDTIEDFQNVQDNQLLDYLGRITSLQASAIETQASAKYWLLEASNQELDRQAAAMKEHKIPPSIAKMRADAMVRDWHYVYEKCERCSRAISHTIDSVRTKISYLKNQQQ